MQLTDSIQTDLTQVNQCLVQILTIVDAQPPNQANQEIKEQAIAAIKLLPISNYSSIIKYC